MRFENIEVDIHKEEKLVHVEIEYPRNSLISTASIGLCDVRATDDIRIEFNFERDGWVIYQPRTYHPLIEGDSYGCETEWIESAFCPAWKYELDEADKFGYAPKPNNTTVL